MTVAGGPTLTSSRIDKADKLRCASTMFVDSSSYKHAFERRRREINSIVQRFVAAVQDAAQILGVCASPVVFIDTGNTASDGIHIPANPLDPPRNSTISKLNSAVHIKRCARRRRRERAAERDALFRHATRLREELAQSPSKPALCESERTRLEAVANDGVGCVEPSSEMVEVSNRWLRLGGQELHRLSGTELSALTGAYNDLRRRAYVTSAAERLFWRPVPDLFENLAQVLPEPPQLRRRRRTARP